MDINHIGMQEIQKTVKRHQRNPQIVIDQRIKFFMLICETTAA